MTMQHAAQPSPSITAAFLTHADIVPDMHWIHTICAQLQSSAQMRIASMQAQLDLMLCEAAICQLGCEMSALV